MNENIFMLVFGILLIPLGIMNIKGNISSIHWYNRTRITEETKPKYGKLMGSAAIIIGEGLIIASILNIVFETEIAALIGGIIACAAAVVGVVIMLYAQIKYNKGIF